MVMSLTPDDDCVSALQSLANLQHLTHLQLNLHEDINLMAFTSAAASASNLQMRYLSVCGALSVSGLM